MYLHFQNICFGLFSSLLIEASLDIEKIDRLDNERLYSYDSNLIQIKDQTFNYKIFEVSDRGFGYDIYQNSKLLIHQPNIPGRPGNRGFSKKSDAQKVANLVIEKLKKGTTPPTITENDLRRLGI